MALFTSTILSQASGKLGGLVFSNNASGAYIRMAGVVTNPNTEAQQVIRGAMRDLAGIWNEDLTDPMVESWYNYAAVNLSPNALGIMRKISAYAWFISFNTVRKQIGLDAILTAPPSGVANASPVTVAVTANDQTMAVTFKSTDTWAGAVGGGMAIYASRATNPNRVKYIGNLRYVGKVLGAAVAPTSPAEIVLPWPATEGMKIHWRVRMVQADGRMSAPFLGNSVIAAGA
jgi:hypothetical protein